MSAKKVKHLMSKVFNPSANQCDMEIKFHGQFPVEDNLLNGLCIASVYVPEELLLNIFVYLSPQDILSCSLVCRRWCNIAKSNALWQTMYNVNEYPKKAKNLPWYVFYCYITSNKYFNNLIKNGNGQEEFKHWTVILNGGDECRVEDPPVGCDLLPENIPEFNGFTSCFATSHGTCCKYQKIDLSSKNLLRYILRKYKPTLYLSEWYAGRFDCACFFKLSLRCDTKEAKWNPKGSRNNNSPVRSSRNEPKTNESTTPNYLKYQQAEIEQWARREWAKMEIRSENYPADDIDAIYFIHEGRDLQFWAGHYGSKMAGGVLKFLFESIEPTSDDIADNDEMLID